MEILKRGNVYEENQTKLHSLSGENEADKKDRKLINQTRRLHKDKILVVMGCFSQLNKDNIDADIIIGNKYFWVLPFFIS